MLEQIETLRNIRVEEEWRDILGYEGIYSVSNTGLVRRVKGKWSSGRILKQHDMKGYRHVSLCKQGKCKGYIVHRLVAQTFIPNPNNHPMVNHRNGDKKCNLVYNLEWCTHQQNVDHSIYVLGFSNAGSSHPRAKLSDLDVLSIRQAEKRNTYGYTKKLALKYGVSASLIRDIWRRRAWPHI